MSRNPMPTWLFAVIAAIFWVVGVGLVVLARSEQEKSHAFMSVARPATGKFVRYVVWKEKEAGLSSRTRERTLPEIEFETETGQTVRFVAASSGNRAFKSLSATPQSQYPVLYDPNDPSHAQLDAGLDKVFWIFYVCALVCAIPAVVFTILYFYRSSA